MTKRSARRSRSVDPVVLAVGKRLRHLREASGYTQEELGRRAKLTAKFISQVENGHANPSIGVVARLSGALALPLSAFFSSESSDEMADDLTAIDALVGAQPLAARKMALRVLRAMFFETDQ